MTYRKACLKANNANSDLSKILRQKFIIDLTQLYNDEEEVWHFDQSTIDRTNHKSRGWFYKWETGNFTGKPLSKRISMCAGVSSRGRIIWSAHTENNNTRSMILFYSEMLMSL